MEIYGSTANYPQTGITGKISQYTLRLEKNSKSFAGQPEGSSIPNKNTLAYKKHKDKAFREIIIFWINIVIKEITRARTFKQ